MLAWLMSGDGDVEEIEVDVSGALVLPDDKLIRIVDLIGALTACDEEVSLHLSDCK